MTPSGDRTATLHDVLRRAGVAYDHYKIKCIERRIGLRMRARGAETYDQYARVLQADPVEAQRLARALTINVSRFFRNWPAYEALAKEVIPLLWDRGGLIRVWSAGCAAGEEAYSVAALFHDFAHRRGELGRAHRVRVLGSDIDEDSLAAARRAVYSSQSLAEAPDDLRKRYFAESDGTAVVSAAVRGLVRFERRDLVLDREPTERFDLILCRNVLIYLEPRAQEALLERFHRCARAGAFLMLGKVEAALGRSRGWFRPMAVRPRIYRRVEGP